MGENTKIEWADHTWNPWIGCTKISPACDHCYAEEMMANRYGRVSWGAGEDRSKTSASTWAAPLKWDRDAKASGHHAFVFCLSLGDIWDNEVDPEWRHSAFDVMDRTPNLTYLLLSKRIGNAEKMCSVNAGNRSLPRNAALGATMVNQDEWDRDAPKLEYAATVLGARFTFASIEPILGPIKMTGKIPDWVIVGGESGREARPAHPDWLRSLRDQCANAGAAFFFKQWGEWSPHQVAAGGDLGRDVRSGRVRIVHPTGQSDVEVSQSTGGHNTIPGSRYMARLGKAHTGAKLDGLEHKEFPA